MIILLSIIICNIFWVNIVVDVIVRADNNEDPELIFQDKKWDFIRVSTLSVILLLIFVLVNSRAMFAVAVLILFITAVTLAQFETVTLIKIQKNNEYITHKIIVHGIKIVPIILFLSFLFKILR